MSREGVRPYYPHRKEFLTLITGIFVSQSGSHFLTIALAQLVFIKTGSAVSASLIFIFSYLPIMFVGGWMGHWVDRKLSGWMLARNELLSILMTCLCGLAVVFDIHPVAFSLLLSIRSLLLFVGRTGGMKWVKSITPYDLQVHRIKLFFLSIFLATAVAGILAVVFLKAPSIKLVVIINVVTYVVSFCIFCALPRWRRSTEATQESNSSNTLASIAEILSNHTLASSFVSVCLAQAIFQGAYSVFIFYLPIKRFTTTSEALGLFQIAAAAGITVGFIIVWTLPRLLLKEGRRIHLLTLTFVAVGLVSTLACTLLTTISSNLLAFFLMNTCYESIWLHNSSEFFRLTPAPSVGRYQFVLTSTASGAMAVATGCYALFIDWAGLLQGSAVVLIIGSAIWGFMNMGHHLHSQQSVSGD